MTSVLVVAPHPDDETLGCGGALLRHASNGDVLHWLIVTDMTESAGYDGERVRKRTQEIQAVADRYGFDSIHNLTCIPARLDQVPIADLVSRIGAVFTQVRPETLYLPYRGDIHSDHRATFDAAAACTKSFRHPYVRRILVYETLSETDFALDPDRRGFVPNVFVSMSEHLDEKIAIAGLYEGEIGVPPFPRSETAIRALAVLRGAVAGCLGAEAFMLLKEIQ